MAEAKPFDVPKQRVWDAYLRVKANRGAAGVDGQSLADFEKDLKGNLYKVWNRMSSGSYFPPPVRLVEIPKGGGGMRPLGIPTVGDRIAQTVAKMVLEPLVEPHFHEDSYAYRSGKSALDAVGVARRRCWRADWVIDLDVRDFFGSLRRDLILKAVNHHTSIPWVRLYVKRWLEAPVELPDGTRKERTRGTPQGGVVSPLLANLFMHYAGVFPHPVRAVCGRCSRPLRERGPDPVRAEGDPFAARQLRSRPSSDQDEDCVLQGQQPSEGIRPSRIRLPRLHLSAEACPQSLREVLRELPACGEHQGSQGCTQDHSRLADGLFQVSPIPGRPRAARESGGAGLGAVLRAVLPLKVAAGSQPPEPGSRVVGVSQVPPFPPTQAGCNPLVGSHCPA